MNLYDLFPFLKGYVTFLSALGLILFGIGGGLSGKVDPETAVQSVLAGIAAFGLGRKLDNVENR